MKKSKYNIFIPYNDSTTIIYNSFSGAVGLFDKDALAKYENDSYTDEEFKLLQLKGIYIDNNFNEDIHMYQDRFNSCYNKKEMFIRLWTTSACNANCFYCFEKGYPIQTMTIETADKVVNYIINHYNNESRITFEWFGGEPLLNTKIIDYIFNKLTPFCNEHNCKLQSEFITNGSLITEEIAKKMKDWNTINVQITLDGNENEYNKIKDYNNKKYNFNSVINGIKLISNNIHTSIRMNYNIDNYESLSSLIDYLAAIKTNKLSCYIYPLWDSLGDNSFKSQAYADTNLIKLFDKLVNYNLADLKLIARLNYKKGVCSSCSTNSIAIFPDGTIGKCSETFNQRLGDITNGITDKQLFDFWTSPEISEECKSCKLLPICQGGCKSSNFTAMPKCHPYKNIINDLIIWYVNKLYKK